MHTDKNSFRIGVVGHRPNRLRGVPYVTIADAIRKEILRIRETVPDRQFVGVSPLAEGSDRIFAKVALEFGMPLICPMPFIQAEYENDFSGGNELEKDSLSEFRNLIESFRTGPGIDIVELDGRRAQETEAYRKVGEWVLQQSEFVVFVWDGQDLGKPGGTDEMIEIAKKRRMDYVVINLTDIPI